MVKKFKRFKVLKSDKSSRKNLMGAKNDLKIVIRKVLTFTNVSLVYEAEY